MRPGTAEQSPDSAHGRATADETEERRLHDDDDGNFTDRSDEPGGRRRRRLLATGGVVTVLLIGSGVVAATALGTGDGSGGGAAATAGLPTATVERRTLEEHAELDGTLGYGDVTDVTVATQGIITGLPGLGNVVDRGQSLVEIDGRSVPLLFGDRPMWRPLGPSVGDGPDVEQLEANLVALGVVTESELTVDQNWTAATTDAVQEWQESLGRDETGAVAPGDLVFLAGAVRVADHPTPIGSPVGGEGGGAVLGVTGSTRMVTIDLEASRRSLVEVDQAVEVVLPDGTVAAATVRSVGAVATADEGGEDGEGGEGGGETEPTVEVTVALDDPAAGGGLDQAPVTVRVVTSAATDVTAVPVAALLALVEGGYAVEVRGDGGSTSLVAVEPGAFADGWVEVTGDVAEGDEVVVPGD